MASENREPDIGDKLTACNKQVVELGRQLTILTKQHNILSKDQVTEQDVSESFQTIEAFWDDLFPMERHRLIQLLIETVEIRKQGIDLTLKTNGFTSLIIELTGLTANIENRRDS